MAPLPSLSSSSGGMIAFLSDRVAKTYELYAMNGDGADPRLLVEAGDGFVVGPSWSPDAQRIAYTKIVPNERGQLDSHGPFEIWVTTLDGDENILLSGGITDEMLALPWPTPTWSPDGTLLAFIAARETDMGETLSSVYVVAADGGGLTWSYPLPWLALGVFWSPLGDALLLVGYDEQAGPSVHVLSIADQELVEIHQNAQAAGWSPDGSEIVVSPVQPPDVMVLEPGGEPRTIARLAGKFPLVATWSPDGKHILVGTSHSSDLMKITALHLVSLDGGESTTIAEVERGEYIYEPNWAPESDRVLYTTTDVNRTRQGNVPYADLWVYDLASGETQQLTSGEFHDGMGVWSPSTDAPTAPIAPSSSLTDGGGLIAFVSTRDGNGEIYVMNSDGSDPRRLTRYREWDGFPTWSPDGAQIAYYSYVSSKNWVIQVMDLDGRNQRQLTDNGICDGAPAWSPDGAWMAFVSDPHCDGDGRDIYVLDVQAALQGIDAGNQRQLTDDAADDHSSAWSPDSQQMAFVSSRDGDEEIYVMNRDGNDLRQLTDNDYTEYAPAWSPDGTQIAFTSDRDGNQEIYLMRADGTDQRRLTDSSADDWFPGWSPDGTQIVFSSRHAGGSFDVYALDVQAALQGDEGAVRQLTDDPGDDFNAVWQPIPAPATWVRTYEEAPEAAALGAVQTEDGGYLLVGATNHTHRDTMREDVHVIKTNSAGGMVWEKTYGGEAYDRGYEIIPAADGGFVILGETESFGAGERDVYLIRIDADGNELWSRAFGGPGRERAFAIQPTTDGGTIITGATTSFGAEGSDVYLLKVDGLGDELWSRAFGGEYDEEGMAVHQTSDGGFFVLAGVTHGEAVYTEQNPDVYLLRTDGAGDEIWSQVWEKEGVQGGNALLPTADGGYIIAGIFISLENGSGMDFLFQKIDGEGVEIWDKTIHDESMEGYAIDIIETSDGGYVLVGMSMRNGRGGIPLIKIDGQGDVVWVRNLVEGRGNKAGMKVFQASDGGYVIAGMTNEGGGQTFDTVLIKTDSQGNVNDD